MKNHTKNQYLAPMIELIELDNQISLALESSPPEGPDESMSLLFKQEFNPAKTDGRC